MSVPILYAGSRYHPVPFVPIPIPPPPVAPQFSSAEVGNVNASTVAVTFDSNIIADGSNYSSGVTIKVNGSTRNFESGIRQANHAVVRYALASPAQVGDTVTWEYSATAGSIVSESNGLALQDVSAQTVTNNIHLPPQFSSAEIGAVNAFTMPVTFDQDVSAANYGAGVTIKVNGTATSITSATRQANHAIVRYVIPILWHGSADVVTWEYAQASGNIVAETGGTALGDVTAQSVTNNCEYAALLDLQADALGLNDGDPVSTWADASGAGRDFTQTGTARPTKQTDAGYPAVVFDGTDDVLVGSDFANALPAFTIMGIANSDVNNSGTAIWISKVSRISTEGWFSELSAGAQIIECFVSYQTNLTGYLFTVTRDIFELGGWRFWTLEKSSDSTGTIYAAGNSTGSVIDNGAGTTFSNTEPVRLGSVGDPITAGDGFWMGSLRGVLIFAPIPAATNRAALEARLAARYGITL